MLSFARFKEISGFVCWENLPAWITRAVTLTSCFRISLNKYGKTCGFADCFPNLSNGYKVNLAQDRCPRFCNFIAFWNWQLTPESSRCWPHMTGLIAGHPLVLLIYEGVDQSHFCHMRSLKPPPVRYISCPKLSSRALLSWGYESFHRSRGEIFSLLHFPISI